MGRNFTSVSWYG